MDSILTRLRQIPATAGKSAEPRFRRRRMPRLLQLVVLLLLASAPAHASFTLSQHLSNTSCGGVSSCAVPGFTAVAAGSFIVGVEVSAGTITPSAGTSGGGIWTVPSGCTTVANCSESDSTAGGVAVQYILSSTGSPTTISCTASTAVIAVCDVIVYTFTASSVSFDVGAVRDVSTAATNLAGESPGTITGTNDAVIQYGAFSGTASSPCPNSAASPGDFPAGDAVCGLINTTSNTAGTYTNTSSRAALGAIAFKEAGCFRLSENAISDGRRMLSF